MFTRFQSKSKSHMHFDATCLIRLRSASLLYTSRWTVYQLLALYVNFFDPQPHSPIFLQKSWDFHINSSLQEHNVCVETYTMYLKIYCFVKLLNFRICTNQISTLGNFNIVGYGNNMTHWIAQNSHTQYQNWLKF